MTNDHGSLECVFYIGHNLNRENGKTVKKRLQLSVTIYKVTWKDLGQEKWQVRDFLNHIFDFLMALDGITSGLDLAEQLSSPHTSESHQASHAHDHQYIIGYND